MSIKALVNSSNLGNRTPIRGQENSSTQNGRTWSKTAKKGPVDKTNVVGSTSLRKTAPLRGEQTGSGVVLFELVNTLTKLSQRTSLTESEYRTSLSIIASIKELNLDIDSKYVEKFKAEIEKKYDNR